MARIELVGIDRVNDILRELPEHQFNAAKRVLGQAAIRAQSKVARNFGSGGNQIHNRTGLLARSIKTKVFGTNLSTLGAELYTQVKYAQIHEEGGIVRAKDKYSRVPGGPYLNQPLPRNLTPAGVMRRNAREVFQAGGYIIKSRTGNWLVMAPGNIPMFLLRKQTVITPRLGMQIASTEQLPWIETRLNDLLLEGL